MTKQDLRELMVSNFSVTPGINFQDKASATRNAMIEYFGLEDLSPREIKIRRVEIMALIEEVIDELLPEKLVDRVGDFAEIKQFARDAEVVFQIKGVGKRRAFLTIKQGQRGGMYQAARLDNKYMTISTWVETVGVFVTLEEILLGKYSLVELMDNILDGFVERLYKQVFDALIAAAALAPAANKAASDDADENSLDEVIRVIAAYGRPMLVGFQKDISKLSNKVTYDTNPNISTLDVDDIRKQGHIGVYKGTPIVIIPNYIINEATNAEWLLQEGKIFVLPANEKPVKVALKGEMHIEEVVHPTGSMEQNAHKMLGVGVLLYNNIGLYEIVEDEGDDEVVVPEEPVEPGTGD